ncbi:MAG TPA: hypothetical protein VJI46_00135 [Candidatus Nanoarchaeia archaeon]|nr:hypothetical protein [Candidatus Nanoarchaeia archaeon]
MRRERSEKKTGAIIVIFIIVIMVMSVVGFLYSGGTSSSKTVNGRKFYATDKGWLLTIDKTQYLFDYLPSDLGIPIPQEVASSMQSPMIYITYDPEDSEKDRISQIQFEIGRALYSKNIYVMNGFTKENPYNLAIITCANATSSIPVIDIRSAGNISLRNENNCIIAESDSSSFLRIKDALVYAALGIT